VHYLVGWGVARPQAGGNALTGLRFDHSMVNDPNLILSQIIQLIKGAMVALLP
jgi:flagellar biosynthetic protein FlhB